MFLNINKKKVSGRKKSTKMAGSDILGILIVIALVIWLCLSVYAHVTKQSIKESVKEIREWIMGTLKK